MGFQKSQETDVLVNFVLDASGSMQSLTQGTVDGFNEFLQGQVDQTEGDVYVSLTLFNTNFDVRFVAVPAAEVPKMKVGAPTPFGARGWGDSFIKQARSGLNEYQPGGMTALFDGVGVAVTGVEEWLRTHPSFTGKVVTVIWTDGGENSSKRYNQASINELIQTKQNQGWIFQFMGTGEEGWRQNDVFRAIPAANRGWTEHKGAGMGGGFHALNNSVLNLRTMGAYGYEQRDVEEGTAARS